MQSPVFAKGKPFDSFVLGPVLKVFLDCLTLAQQIRRRVKPETAIAAINAGS